MQSELLYSSKDVYGKIQNIFCNPKRKDRRIAIVAYIGSDVATYLPSPKGMLVICNPDPYATSYEAIQYLVKMGAKVQFSNRLHMKIYYSKERGCIITSANLSRNALGGGNLKEVGMFVDSNKINIDKIISYVNPYEITDANMAAFELSSKKAAKNVKKHSLNNKKTYSEWFTSPYRMSWKSSYYDGFTNYIANSARDQIFKDFGKAKPEDCITCAKDQLKNDDWLLCFETRNNKISGIYWMYINFIVKMKSNEKDYSPEYPYQAIQVHKISKYPSPPFNIDNKFKTAFRSAVKSFGLKKIIANKNLIPNNKVLKLIDEFYCSNRRS